MSWEDAGCGPRVPGGIVTTTHTTHICISITVVTLLSHVAHTPRLPPGTCVLCTESSEPSQGLGFEAWSQVQEQGCRGALQGILGEQTGLRMCVCTCEPADRQGRARSSWKELGAAV